MKLSEQFGVDISFKPKPLQNPWNNSSLNVFFSTTESREENGIIKLNTYIDNLTNKHKDHMAIYGDNSEKIPSKSGKSDTTNLNICIPNKVTRERKGYLQDNRPVSDADPYIVIGKIFDTCCVSID